METRTDTDALRAEIEQTRAELGDTAAALAAKADVKSRMKESAGRASQRVRDTADRTLGQATDVAGRLRVQVADRARNAKRSARTADLGTMTRGPAPAVLLAVAAVAAAGVVFLVRRSRR